MNLEQRIGSMMAYVSQQRQSMAEGYPATVAEWITINWPHCGFRRAAGVIMNSPWPDDPLHFGEELTYLAGMLEESYPFAFDPEEYQEALPQALEAMNDRAREGNPVTSIPPASTPAVRAGL